MKTTDLLNIVSPGVRALNPGLFPAQPAQGADHLPDAGNMVAVIAEKDLQAAVEAYLDERKYYRMTPASFTAAIRGEIAPRGFFGHWTENERNPLISDCLIISWPVPRPPLLLELKVRDSFTPGQKQACTLGFWKLAWNLSEAQSIIEAWDTP